jgi:ATP-dependent protease ClpP protease subunit
MTSNNENTTNHAPTTPNLNDYPNDEPKAPSTPKNPEAHEEPSSIQYESACDRENRLLQEIIKEQLRQQRLRQQQLVKQLKALSTPKKIKAEKPFNLAQALATQELSSQKKTKKKDKPSHFFDECPLNNLETPKQKKQENWYSPSPMENPIITLCLPKPITPQTYEKTIKKIARFHAHHPDNTQIDTTLWLEGISNNHAIVENIINLLKTHASGKLTAILSGHGEDATLSLLMAADEAIALPHTFLQFNTEKPQHTKSATYTATRISKKILETLTKKIKPPLELPLEPALKLALELPDNLSVEGHQIATNIKKRREINDLLTRQIKTKGEVILNSTPPLANLATTLSSMLTSLRNLKTHLTIIQWINQTKTPDWITTKTKNIALIQEPLELATAIWQKALFASFYLHSEKIKLSAPDALKLGLIDKIDSKDPCHTS